MSAHGESGKRLNCDGNSVAPPSSVFAPHYERESEPEFPGHESAHNDAVAISEDGSRVFFQSPVALTPEALNDVCVFERSGHCEAAAQNVYEWEDGNVYLISDGQDLHSIFEGSSTQLIGADPSGSNVFFLTADSLVPQDTDTQVDIYDARVDGGLTGSSADAACSSECAELSSGAPAFSTPGTIGSFGAGNLTPAPPHMKPRGAAQVRAEEFARALKACRVKRNRRERAVCESVARRWYGVAGHANKPNKDKDGRGRR
jgi:hypothetical protein